MAAFFLERDQASARDPMLSRLKGFATVIKLALAPEIKAEDELGKALQELRPENFLPFSHLRVFQVVLEDQAWVWR